MGTSGQTTTVSEGGRPRTFTDESCFRATTKLLAERGPAGLSLAAVAREVGCTGPALSIRFGSRIGLLEAYFDWTSQREAERFRQMSEQYTSPLAALRARFLIPVEERPEELSDPRGHANGLSMFVEAHGDERFRRIVISRLFAFEEDLVTNIQAAIDAGELKDCDPKELSHFLFSAMIGATTIWSLTKDGPIVNEIIRIIDNGIGPYRTDTA